MKNNPREPSKLNYKTLLSFGSIVYLSCLVVHLLFASSPSGALVLLKHECIEFGVVFSLAVVFLYMHLRKRKKSSNNATDTSSCDCTTFCATPIQSIDNNDDTENQKNGATQLETLACSSEPQEKSVRLQHLSDLIESSFICSRRKNDGLTHTFKREVEDEMIQFIEGERQCCSHLGFDILCDKETLYLTITAPKNSLDRLVILLKLEKLPAKIASLLSTRRSIETKPPIQKAALCRR